MTTPPSPDLLTVAETAAYLRLHERTVLRLLHKGELPGRRVGRGWRVRRADLEARVAPGGRAEGRERG